MRAPYRMRRTPTVAEAASVLARAAAEKRRAPVRAKARVMREALGLPPAEVLR